MLSLWLDENISYAVVAQIKAKRPDISIETVFRWKDGLFLKTSDEAILTAATEEGMTLVTYDRDTILPLLAQWAERERFHHGVIFISHRSIPSNDFGGLVRSLINLWDERQSEDWSNRVMFLRPAGK
jgi:hypothetical protein